MAESFGNKVHSLNRTVSILVFRNDSLTSFIQLICAKLSTFLSLLSATVLHDHVHCVCAVRGSLALLVRLLLEGSVADPVLDWRCHHPRHAGKSCVLLRIPEHPLQRRLRLVDFIYLFVCGIMFFLFTSVCCNHHFVCVSQQFKAL